MAKRTNKALRAVMERIDSDLKRYTDLVDQASTIEVEMKGIKDKYYTIIPDFFNGTNGTEKRTGSIPPVGDLVAFFDEPSAASDAYETAKKNYPRLDQYRWASLLRQGIKEGTLVKISPGQRGYKTIAKKIGLESEVPIYSKA